MSLPTTDDTATSGRPRAVSVLLTAVVLTMVAMWGYVLYLAFGPGRADSPDKLEDATFAREAEARCSVALDRIAALPLAIETETPEERAEVLDEANGHLAEMLDDLEALAPSGEEGELVSAWLQDWRTYLADREDYAADLRDDPDARLLVTPKGGDQITDYIEAFAQANAMPACSTPLDAS